MTLVKTETLETLTFHIFHALGFPEEEARTAAQIIVDSNLAGHDSHGVNMMARYVRQIRDGEIVPGAPTTVVKETASTAALDGGRNLGHVVAKRAMELAIEKARKTDIACVVVRRLNHIGRVGTYPEIAVQAGMVGIACCSSAGAAPEQTPFGGRQARLGTNPISIGIPSNLDGPILLDMATSVVAAGKVRIARSRNERVPTNWVLDPEGRPSTDPEAFFSGGTLLPLGGDAGHKGYGLAFAVEALCGILSRDGYSREGSHRFSNSSFMIALNPEVFLALTTLKDEVGDLTRFLKDTPTMPGVKEVMYPGEKEAKSRRERLAHGVEVEESTWSQLKAFVRELNLEKTLPVLP